MQMGPLSKNLYFNLKKGSSKENYSLTIQMSKILNWNLPFTLSIIISSLCVTRNRNIDYFKFIWVIYHCNHMYNLYEWNWETKDNDDKYSEQVHEELDVDPQRDDDASPMSTYRCMLRPTWMISLLQHMSKYKSNSISNFFEKKNQIFLVPML